MDKINIFNNYYYVRNLNIKLFYVGLEIFLYCEALELEILILNFISRINKI